MPKGHYQSVFGFVSIHAKMANGTKNATYGNLLDNISFKEYYYIQISNATNGGGGMLEITNDDGTYTEIATDIFVNLPDDDGVFRVDLNNGFRVAAGETYLFTFVGCVDGLSVCHDVCYAVIGYGR